MIDLEFLQSIRLFSDLSERALGLVREAIIERELGTDDLVFRESDPGTCVYFVHTGKIKICRYSLSGQEFIIGVWGPGSPFGLIAALDGGDYPATALALVPTKILALRVSALQQLADEIPALKAALMNQVGLRIRLFQDRVYERDLLDARGKLASLLLTLARSTGVKAPAGVRVAYGLTQRDLGAMIGARRETVSRILAEFQKDNLVELRQAGILITDLQNLQQFAAV